MEELDIVLFEFASHGAALGLARCLRPDWPTWTEPSGSAGWTVGVSIEPGPTDLARLLRRATEWVAAAHLPGITLELDGRLYSLPPARRRPFVDAPRAPLTHWGCSRFMPLVL